MEDKRNSFPSETATKGSFSSVSSKKSQRVADNFEPIDIEGQKDTGIWIHHPGSEISQIWEPRKGKTRRIDTEIHGEPNGSMSILNEAASGSSKNDTSSTDENPDDNRPMKSVRRGLKKIGSVFHRSPKKEDHTDNFVEAVPSPHINIRAANEKEIGVTFVVDDDHCVPASGKNSKEESASLDGDGPDSPSKGNMKDMAKSFLKQAGKSARGIKHALSRKGSKTSRGETSVGTERESSIAESDSSDDESNRSPGAEGITIEGIPVTSKAANESSCSPGAERIRIEQIPVTSKAASESSCSPGAERIRIEQIPVTPKAISSGDGNSSLNSEEHAVQTTKDGINTEGPKENESLQELDGKYDKKGSPDSHGDEVEESLEPKLAGVDLEGKIE